MNVFALILAQVVAATSYSNGTPPEKYQGNPPMSQIVIIDNANSEDTCGVAASGWHFMACSFRGKNGIPVILMPNLCLYPEAKKDPYSYAHLLCHEFGHVNGWNAEHNN